MGQKHSSKTESQNNLIVVEPSVRTPPPLPPVRPPPRWTEDSFKLLWVRKHLPRYQLLGISLMRDLCGYIEGIAVLFLVRPTHLYIRNVITEDVTTIQLYQDLDLNSTWVSVALPDWRVFVLCAGTGKKGYEIMLSGDVVETQECWAEHRHPGAVYCPEKGCVYMFGGNSSQCEKLNEESHVWTLLPELSTTRSYFHPCLYQHHIYLCGGFACSIELYHTPSDTFLTAPSILLPEESDCLCLAKDYNVIIISQKYTCCWNLFTNKLSLCCKTGLCPWSIPHAFAALGRRLYFEIPGGGVATGDLLKGEFARKGKRGGVEEMADGITWKRKEEQKEEQADESLESSNIL